MNTLTDINKQFTDFTGSENWYRHSGRCPGHTISAVLAPTYFWGKCRAEGSYLDLFGYHYTDGVKFMAEKLQAYWLIDAVFSYGRKEEFQIWTLEVSDRKGFLSMREDTNCPFIVTQKIPYTDFPEGIFKMYLIDGILILPSEY